MLSLILAAAVSAASPQPAASLQLGFKHWGEDAPLVCVGRFEEEQRLAAANLPLSESKVIDLYAAKAKLSKKEKIYLTGYCDMFDVGVFYAVSQIEQQQEDAKPEGLDKPGDHIASFNR